MRKILTAGEMREVDRLTTEKYGIPSILLMENAAHAAARAIAGKFDGSIADKNVLILWRRRSGSGANFVDDGRGCRGLPAWKN